MNGWRAVANRLWTTLFGPTETPHMQRGLSNR
jgi:hypothetical protein